MELPERKSQTLIRAIREFNATLKDLQGKYKAVSDKIIERTSELVTSGDNRIEIVKAIEDLEYEMENNVLLNLEIAVETLDGFEVDIIDVEPYIPSIKDEKELLVDLNLSVKNFVKTSAGADETLNEQEKSNLLFIHDSYTKLAGKTLENMNEILNLLTKQLKKVKKMEDL